MHHMRSDIHDHVSVSSDVRETEHASDPPENGNLSFR